MNGHFANLGLSTVVKYIKDDYIMPFKMIVRIKKELLRKIGRIESSKTKLIPREQNYAHRC
jgi:hypothetical protein